MRKKISEKEAIFILNSAVYPLEAIYGASYIFIDKAYIFLDRRGKDIEVVLRPKEASTVGQVESLAGEFTNELLNYILRINLSKENKKIRQYLVERALFSSVKEEEGDGGSSLADLGYSFEEDPLGIAVPWEEKYGSSAGKTDKKNK